MFTIETFTTFLGWCSVINMSIFIISALSIALVKKPIIKIHGYLMGVEQETLPNLYFQYLGNFKIAVIILNITPYIALKIMF